jgi:hypothetical protein
MIIFAMFCCAFGLLSPSPQVHATARDIWEPNRLACGYETLWKSSYVGNWSIPAAEALTRRDGYDASGQSSLHAWRPSAVAISISALTQPPPIVERTAAVSTSYMVTYPNGSLVKTSANARANVQRGGQVVATVPLNLNETSGAWTATWISPYSANLTEYSFTLNPADYNDSYGNTGQGQVLVSSPFKLVPADVVLTIRASPILSRRQNETIVVPTVYHDGSRLRNATMEASIVDANGTASPFNLTLTGASARNNLDLPADAHLGTWQIEANFTDGYGNHGKGNFSFQVVKANITFSVTIPQPVERTTTLNVTAAVTYPDGQPLSEGVNGNVTIGNMTETLNLEFLSDNKTWNVAYPIVQNATLGLYNVTIGAADPYDNLGRFTTLVPVVPASFRFTVPTPQVQVPPVELTDIVVSVVYPNGTALSSTVGVVTATYNDPTGGITTLVLAYNATDTTWHVPFLSPDQRFKLYPITLVFSFEAKDLYGNYGSAADAYQMTVTTPIFLLVAAAVAGVTVPAALLAWAMVTVSKRRRKHKP